MCVHVYVYMYLCSAHSRDLFFSIVARGGLLEVFLHLASHCKNISM